jgi:hypothetical protein
MPKLKATTQVVAKFDNGRDVTAPRAIGAGKNVQKHIVLGAGKAAFGIGAAIGAVSGFAKGLFS